MSETITIEALSTATNRYAFDIVNDINAQLDKIAGIKFDHDNDADTAMVNPTVAHICSSAPNSAWPAA